MPANPVFGRAGQGYTGLGAMGRAQGAQSRFALPQRQTAMGRVGQRAAAGAGQMRQEWLSLWGRVAERQRAEELAALGALGRQLGLGIGKWRARREDEEERRRRLALARFGPQEAGVPSGPGAVPRAFEAPPVPGPYGAPTAAGLPQDIVRELVARYRLPLEGLR
jgi:hypothetical protein